MKKERLEYLDFAKGFAILSIVILHYSQPYVEGIWAKAIMFGGSGVHLFFLLSGVGLGLSRKLGVFDFYKRRFVKILVPYYIVILFIYLVNDVLPVYQGVGVYAFLGHILFYKMFDENIMTSFGYHFWFMSTIIQFYVLFPAINMLKEKMSLIWFVLGSLLVSIIYWILITYFGLGDQRVFNSSLLQFFWEFNIGVVLADLYKDKNIRFWDLNTWWLLVFAATGVSLMAILSLVGGVVGKTFNDIPALMGYFSLSVLVYLLCQRRLKVVNSCVIYVGRISYELYLIHMIVFILMNMFAVNVLGLKMNIFCSLLVLLPLAVISANYFSILQHKLSQCVFKT